MARSTTTPTLPIPSISPPTQNFFLYKTETPQSLLSRLPFEFDDHLPGVSHNDPVKASGKVPRSPYKVVKLLDLGIMTVFAQLVGLDVAHILLLAPAMGKFRFGMLHYVRG